MKRFFALFLAGVLCFSLVACATENKYAELEKMLDEGRYSEAMTYILSLQAGTSSSVPLFVALPDIDGTYTDEDLDADKEPDAAVLALIDELMKEWVIASENEDAPQKFVFRADGTCTVDGTEMTWKREAASLSDNTFNTFLSVWEGETERYRIQQPTKSDAGELSFSITRVKENSIMSGIGPYICLENYEAVELTMDNWQEYFEIVEKPHHSTNAFGEVSGMGITYYLALKEECYDQLSEHKAISDAAVELEYTSQRRHARINSDGKTYSIGEAAGEGYHHTETSSLGWYYSSNYYEDGSGYIGCRISSGYLENHAADTVFLPGVACVGWCVRDISLLRIQGTLYLLKEQ